MAFKIIDYTHGGVPIADAIYYSRENAEKECSRLANAFPDNRFGVQEVSDSGLSQEE